MQRVYSRHRKILLHADELWDYGLRMYHSKTISNILNILNSHININNIHTLYRVQPNGQPTQVPLAHFATLDEFSSVPGYSGN